MINKTNIKARHLLLFIFLISTNLFATATLKSLSTNQNDTLHPEFLILIDSLACSTFGENCGFTGEIRTSG